MSFLRFFKRTTEPRRDDMPPGFDAWLRDYLANSMITAIVQANSIGWAWDAGVISENQANEAIYNLVNTGRIDYTGMPEEVGPIPPR